LGLELGFNQGSGFSLFSGQGAVAESLAVVVAVVVGVLAWRARTTLLAVGFGLVLGGAIGNLSDRWFRPHHGAVIDYVTLTHWPTFNVADACITIGIVVVAVWLVLSPGRSGLHRRALAGRSDPAGGSGQ